VTGFLPDLVEAEIARRNGPLKAEPFFNPFFQVADNLASCWMVRERMKSDFLLINGDTLFTLDLISAVMAAPPSPILVTIDQKSAYDLDDMKVTLAGTRLAAIGKTLAPEETNAESIGILRFSGSGPALFREKLEQMMRTQDGIQSWFLKAINAIASTGTDVGTVLIKGHRWAEVDTPADFNALKENGF
jgi:choline kinase